MDRADAEANRRKIWQSIKHEHVALLVTVGRDGALDARPMGCLQKEFGGTLWFMTFRNTPKLIEITADSHVLVSYARRKKYEFVSLSGRARLVEDREEVRALWNEGLRVWFPGGPESSNMALIAVDVETAKIWTKPASIWTYAYYYVRARLTGKAAKAREVADVETLRL